MYLVACAFKGCAVKCDYSPICLFVHVWVLLYFLCLVYCCIPMVLFNFVLCFLMIILFLCLFKMCIFTCKLCYLYFVT